MRRLATKGDDPNYYARDAPGLRYIVPAYAYGLGNPALRGTLNQNMI